MENPKDIMKWLRQVTFDSISKGETFMAKFCRSCGVQLNENAAFCTSCGAAYGSPSSKTERTEKPGVKETKTMDKSTNFNVFSAAVVPGEFGVGNVLPMAGLSVPGLNQIMGPFKYLGSSFVRTIKGIKSVFKDKKLLISVIVLAVTWLVLNLLPALGVDAVPVRVLSFLTFAKGGTTGGALGIIGGLAGKGLFAYFITSMVIPIFIRKKKTKSQNGDKTSKSGISQFFSSLGESFGSIALLPSLLSGCAVALLLYNFMTGDNSIQDAMAGISALFLSVRAVSNKSGFLRGFLTSLFNKRKGKKTEAKDVAGAGNPEKTARTVKRFIAGITLGFAMAIPLSVIGYSYTAYIAGAVLILASIVLFIVSKSKKEVTV